MAATLYTPYFGLTEAPFRATPDPRIFYSNDVYREAYATLLYGVVQRKGFIVLTGEIGTGKTTLLRRLMDELGPPVRFVLFYNTTLGFDETVEFICGELDLPVDRLNRVQRLQRLNDLLIAEARQGGNVVLLIDEAQNLGRDVLENLRLISNLETSTEKLLQVVLIGQPELAAKLRDPALRQVAQRIALRYHLTPLRDHEIADFIGQRLRRCGAARPLFTPDAIARIAAYSNGVPRVINIICDGALLAAYGAGMPRVTGAIVDEVATDLTLTPRNRWMRRLAMASVRGMFRRRRAPTWTMPALRWVTPGVVALGLGAVAAALLPHVPLTMVADTLGFVERRVEAGATNEHCCVMAVTGTETWESPAIAAIRNALVLPSASFELQPSQPGGVRPPVPKVAALTPRIVPAGTPGCPP
jgi:general secretion pathway protein A